jgi:8-oxo-dGTP pyrophosphatase MutT (NUDIX family)
MKKEYSYGAVVYQFKDGIPLYLIEHMAMGHTSLPKGHIEEGETPLQCTLREIKEETNLDVDVDMSFSHLISYSPKPNVIKDVTFYLATPKTFNLKLQLEEVSSMEWMPFDEALEALTHETDKGTLTAAHQAVLSKHGLK